VSFVGGIGAACLGGGAQRFFNHKNLLLPLQGTEGGICAAVGWVLGVALYYKVLGRSPQGEADEMASCIVAGAVGAFLVWGIYTVINQTLTPGRPQPFIR